MGSPLRAVLDEAGVKLGKDYPLPVVDLKASRLQRLRPIRRFPDNWVRYSPSGFLACSFLSCLCRGHVPGLDCVKAKALSVTGQPENRVPLFDLRVSARFSFESFCAAMSALVRGGMSYFLSAYSRSLNLVNG